MCHLSNTVTFIQRSLTCARTHTQWAQMWEHVVSRSSPGGATPPLTFGFLHFFHSSSPSCGNQRSVELGSDTPSLLHHHPQIHQTKTPPQHTPALPFNTPLLHPSWTLTHRRLPAQQEIILQFEKSRMELWRVTRCSWTAGSRDRRWSGGGGWSRWCGCNFRRVPLNGSLL